MPPTDRSLDEQIAEVERRLADRRVQLRALAAEARSRVSVTKTVPVALVAALAVGFAASRFVRKPAAPPPAMRKGSRATRLAGAIASALLPRLVAPLQSAATQWLHQRMRRSAAH